MDRSEISDIGQFAISQQTRLGAAAD